MKEFEIFRTGTWTSDKGITKEYTESDLDKLVENYNSEDPAPIVIGHPQTNAPAYGWIEKIKRVADRLIAVPKQLNEDFVKLVKEGAFKKRSVSFTPEFKLNHVGFLGAAAPAVAGLKEIQFNAEEDLLSFSEDFNPELVSSRAESRDEGFNNETMQQLNNNGNKQAISFDTENKYDNKTVSDYAEAIKNLSTIVSELKQNFTQLNDEEITSLNNRLNELQFAIQVNEFESRLNEKLLYGYVTPAMKDKIMSLVSFIQKQNFNSEEFSFNQYVSDVKAKLVELVDAFPKLNLSDEFAKKPDNTIVHTDEFSDVTVDEDSLEVHKKALQYMLSNDGISYVEAINKIANQ